MLVQCKGRAGGEGEWSAVTFGDLCLLTRGLPTTLEWAYEKSTHLHPATAEQPLSVSEHKRKQISLSILYSILYFYFLRMNGELLHMQQALQTNWQRVIGLGSEGDIPNF